jgi:DNA repair protein RecN (Recombination protein N)
MLLELHARDLGVIADLTLTFGGGMTAVTGETGAGKTLVVEAIELLVGGRADPALVRPGAEEARAEGRFLLEGEELVLARVVPRNGRSRAYVNGRLATAGELAELGQRLVDLHGQHAHQSLLSPRLQRAALDAFGGVDLSGLREARARLAAVEQALAALGGDERARAREMDLLRYQLAELAGAAIENADEDERLELEEDALADAADHRQAADEAYNLLLEDGGAADGIARAVATCAGRRPLAELEDRLRAVAAEVAEAAAELRRVTERIVVDPERLEEVRARRRLLADLKRKYGERLSDVLIFQGEARAQLAELEQHGERAQALERERAEVARLVEAEAAAVAAARRAAAPRLAAAVEAHLQSLAMAGARFSVAVEGPGPADEVTFLLGANVGEADLPLAKVASGGELARAMLALRLALGPGQEEDEAAGPATLVFDEVDAGIGGQAARAVGQALATLAGRRQVVVVTHLPQVAAFADHQVAVSKHQRAGRTVAEAAVLSEEGRVVELSRMLSGQPASATARGHAEELLAAAAQQRASQRTNA